MISRFRIRSMFPLACLSLFLLTAPSASSVGRAAPAEKKAEKTEVDIPLAIVCAASADRLISDVHFTFKSAGATGMSEVINGLLGNVNNLKGMDKTKPFGVMVYLETDFPPKPVVIGFFPVKNIDELLKTVSNGPFTAEPVKGEKNRYRIIGPDQTLQVLLKQGYAFIGTDETALDRTFPDPAKVAGPLAARYDIAVAVNMNSIAKDTRKLLATLFRASAEAELQQRDEEPKAAYEARRASGESMLEFVEYVLLDTKEVVIGFDASSKNRNLVLEVSLKAVPNSKLSKYLKEKSGKRSYFANLVNATAPLSASLSQGLTKSESQAVAKIFKLLAHQVTRGLHVAKTRGAKSGEKTKKPAPPAKGDDAADTKKTAEEIPKNPAIETII
ncbi:MAG: hypothetical protein IID45_06115, partial [Planctomycetes bacterium]|nr:hypothetical protein [Planctomycetota bacterium]